MGIEMCLAMAMYRGSADIPKVVRPLQIKDDSYMCMEGCGFTEKQNYCKQQNVPYHQQLYFLYALCI